MKKILFTLFLVLGATSLNIQADVETAKVFAKKYAVIAKTINPDFKGCQPDIGRQFFTRKLLVEGKEVSCSSCHTDNPANMGENINTHKKIQPLSPVVNKTRFADLEKTEEKFTEHCNDIRGKDCTAQEKCDYIAYLLTVGIESSGKERGK